MFPSAQALFMIPNPSACVSPALSVRSRDERHPGCVEGAERDRGEDDEQRDQVGVARDGERDRDAERGGERQADRQQPAAPVGEAAE